ncbi:MAG: NADH-quinone oxidoreductase subunit N [Bdellovibrionales bacterium CG10_big_fil_rev_8_21_14_0_10_45_34]|nr:MAG: NADH-quinone oxidoreductase subunit N [Bdellovibrionales bacterium CG10_big_fil_rev_8_21_14_0_10_45_34]
MNQFTIGLSDVWLALPLLILFLGSMVPLTVRVLSRNQSVPPFIAVGVGVVVAVLALITIFYQWDNRVGLSFASKLVFDGISSWTSAVVLFTGILVMWLSLGNPATRSHQSSEQVFLILNSALAMMVLAAANDLIIVFIGIELMSLALYVLVGMSNEERLAKEAAFKYFILGSFASAIYLFGVAFVDGIAQTTNFIKLAESAPGLASSQPLFLMGMVGIIVGLGFKVSLFPFHAWTPDVYQGAPTPITAFLATASKLAVFVVLVRIFSTRFLVGVPDLITVLQWLTILTIFLGNFAALRQTNFKRMLAYSSIAHSGYIMTGLIAAGLSSNATFAASGVLFYLLTYTLMNVGAFAVLSLFEKNENTTLLLEDFKGLGRSRPWVAVGLTICLLSLAGIPPMAGFFGKLFLFSAAIEEGLVWLVVWGLLGSVVGVYYYLRPIVLMYMADESLEPVAPGRDWFSRSALGVCAVLTLFLGIFSSPFYGQIQQAIFKALE